MLDLLLAPGAPFFALSLVGVLIATTGLLRIERGQLLATGLRSLPARWGMGGRYLLGQLAALSTAGTLLLVTLASGAQGMPRLLLLSCTLGIYLYIGVVIPRRPLLQAQQEQRRLRALVPGFVNYIRIALAGFDSPGQLLERYVARPDRRRAPLQAVVAEALSLRERERYQPFEALRVVAQARRCRELVDVAEALAQSELEGTNPLAGLAAQELVLNAVLEDEFKRMLSRRQIYLLVMVAFSLIVGVLGNLLWVMVAGSGVLG